MGRVEETNKAMAELQDTVIKSLSSTCDTHAAIAHVIIFQTGVNEEIAKSLAQLADDIHCLREKISKWLEEDEEPKTLGPKCLDCKHSDIMNYVDNNGVLNRNVEWCHHKSQRINLDTRPACDYFEPKEAES